MSVIEGYAGGKTYRLVQAAIACCKECERVVLHCDNAKYIREQIKRVCRDEGLQCARVGKLGYRIGGCELKLVVGGGTSVELHQS